MRWFWQRQPAARQDLTEERRLELMLQQTGSTAKTISQKKDLEAIRDEGVLRLILRSAGESFAQGFDGVLQDGSLMCMDWGFRIEDIRADLPVQLWYGRLDTSVPLNHGEQIAARLGGRAYLRVEDETHASIGISRRDDVLKALVGRT
jgi:pimeloyl-ACP methyl ester carboxylesterase